MKWFENSNSRRLFTFLEFDIKEFGPYIKDTSFNEAIQFAKEHVSK